MTDDKVRIGLVYGSVRMNRFCDTVATWASARILEQGAFTLDPIDPRSLGGSLWRFDRDSGELRSLRERLGQADAFVVVTPEYNHGYTAALKAVIDASGREWQAKPVAFVCYGGVSGGLRAVEQLRLVFAEMHAVAIRDTVSFANPWGRFDSRGEPVDPEKPAAAMATMLARLDWWARALRTARGAAPYEEAVA